MLAIKFLLAASSYFTPYIEAHLKHQSLALLAERKLSLATGKYYSNQGVKLRAKFGYQICSFADQKYFFFNVTP